ncbi:hypothetical protein [Dehalobacter sp. TeCB1]|uniref:hypothetical protein n=1 Tax=Dehalobacter sp. TeCB1 TaxID=1843715 RepID=UPI00083B7B3B|nr:hypothetical protein [Dehalobacter sp. TeCB1]OCZ51378.1 hypothetical protein A7D23_13230 [Dehalobacter sp. TeCB1]
MNTYFYHLHYFHPRTGKKTGTLVGVLFAEDQEQAEKLALEKHGSDSAAGFEISAVNGDGESFYIPR